MTHTLTLDAYDADLASALEGIMDWFDAAAPADGGGYIRAQHVSNVHAALVNEWCAGRDYDEWVRAASARVGVVIP